MTTPVDTTKKRKLNDTATTPIPPAIQAKTEVMAKQGDVVLQLGTTASPNGRRNILVSSLVLSLASPVFATMFGGRFLEDQALSTTTPRTIPLPDDDPESIVIICKITHVQISELERTLSASALADLALVCHKYNCADAVRAWGVIWVTSHLESPNASGFEKTLLASYLLDLPHEFFKVSQSLIRDLDEPFTITSAMCGQYLLPTETFDRILKAQNDCVARILAALSALITGQEFCDGAKQGIWYVFEDLRTHGLWPVRRQSLAYLKRRLPLIPEVKAPNKACHDSCCTCKATGSMISKLLADINHIHSSVQGLYLDCVKATLLKTPPSACRMKHGDSGCLSYP